MDVKLVKLFIMNRLRFIIENLVCGISDLLPERGDPWTRSLAGSCRRLQSDRLVFHGGRLPRDLDRLSWHQQSH